MHTLMRSQTYIFNRRCNRYRENKKLSGVIYMHRISDFKLGGISRRNFNMFRSLCGDTTLRNVCIVTNMWNEVDEQRGVARESELASDDALFKPVLDKGAHLLRHQNTLDTAHEILKILMDNHPLPLQIQEEVVDQKKEIEQTTAGEELKAPELREAERVHAEAAQKQREAMAAALRAEEERREQQIAELRRQQEEREEELRRERAEERRWQREERRKEEQRRKAAEKALEEERAAYEAEQQRVRRLEAERARQEREQEEERRRHQERLREEESDNGDCRIF